MAPAEFDELWEKLKENKEKEKKKFASICTDAQKPLSPGQPKPNVAVPSSNAKVTLVKN